MMCEDPKEWKGVPPPEYPASVRGEETSIAMISTELGVASGLKSGSIGKRLEQLYSNRYGEEEANNIPKRLVIST